MSNKKKSDVSLSDIQKQVNEIKENLAQKVSNWQNSIKKSTYWKENPLLLLGAAFILLIVSNFFSFIFGRSRESNSD